LTSRADSFFELLAGAVLIFGYIWGLYPTYPSWHHAAWILIIILLLVYSQYKRWNGFKEMGFRLDNFIQSGKVLLIISIIAMLLLGLVWSFVFPVDTEFYKNALFWKRIPTYPFWALFQQYIALVFFLGRLKEVFSPHYIPAVILSAAIFSAIHAPNLPLMIVGFVAGLIYAYIYHLYNNIITIALSHALLGIFATYFLLMYVNVGPWADINRWSREKPVHYRIELINGQKPDRKKTMVVKTSEISDINISGWAKGSHAPVEKVYVQLYRQDDYPVVYHMNRIDITRGGKMFNWPNCGFKAKIPIKSISPGYYALRLKVQLTGKLCFHYPRKKYWIKVE
jgi:membrane protease YdiL (CAAX protease family)